MKKQPSGKLFLGKIKVARLTKAGQEVLKGGKNARCTDVEFCGPSFDCR